jgi:hypothetical protein
VIAALVPEYVQYFWYLAFAAPLVRGFAARSDGEQLC